MLSAPFRLTRSELRLVLGAVVLMVVAYGVCVRFLFRLDREPVTLPVPEISEEDERAVSAFNAQLHGAISAGKHLQASLNSEQLNAWLRLSTVSALRLIGEHSWLRINGSTVRASISLPLEMVGRPGLYLNADGAVTGAITSGRCELRIEELRSRSLSSQGVTWLISLLYRDSLPKLLQLESLLPAPFLQRCTARLANSTVEIACAADSRAE